jgi:hypothetical protein
LLEESEVFLSEVIRSDVIAVARQEVAQVLSFFVRQGTEGGLGLSNHVGVLPDRQALEIVAVRVESLEVHRRSLQSGMAILKFNRRCLTRLGG